MNKIFKKVWNRRRGCFVAVSEAMTAASQNTGKAAVITAGLALALASTPSYAIYKHIYAGESTAGQNLDYAEQDYSLNLHGNYTVGAGSNVSWSVRGRAAFNIGPDNTVTTVNGNLLLHSWHSEDLGHFTWTDQIQFWLIAPALFISVTTMKSATLPEAELTKAITLQNFG